MFLVGLVPLSINHEVMVSGFYIIEYKLLDDYINEEQVVLFKWKWYIMHRHSTSCALERCTNI